MTIYYSKTSNSFFIDGLHETVPTDKVEINTDAWQHLLATQSPTAQISSDANGNPVLIDPSNGGAVVYTSVGQT